MAEMRKTIGIGKFEEMKHGLVSFDNRLLKRIDMHRLWVSGASILVSTDSILTVL